MKLQRNEPCWCGSGKKYKNCHRQFDEKLTELKLAGKKIPPHSMIKNEAQIAGIREAAIVNTGLLEHIGKNIKAGMTTQDIDDLTVQYLKDNGGESADLGYQGYPKSICTSINDVVCHGIPSKDVVLKDGDIINVDATTKVNGYFADASRMYLIGEVTPAAKKLVEDTKKALEIAMAAVVPYKSCIGDIGAAIEKFAHENGYSVVEEFCGHGVGLALHEDPYVFHFKANEKTVQIVPGMVFTIEPMLNLGKRHVYIDANDGWTVRTQDGSLSAQWEHTFLVTEEGLEIISQ